MASKVGKRKKTAGVSSSLDFNTKLFRSLGCKIRYDSFPTDRNFVRERALLLTPGDFEDIQENIRNRGWQSLVSYPIDASKTLAKEFLANAYQPPDEKRPQNMTKYHSYVRGTWVPFDPNTINGLFGLPSVENCQFVERLKRDPKVDMANQNDIRAALCRPDEDWWRNQYGTPRKIKAKSLTPTARGWGDFVLHTLTPCSNSSELNIYRASLVTSIILGELINVGTILATELYSLAMQEADKTWWQHAGLIGLLCAKVGVVPEIGEEALKRGEPITGNWIRMNSRPIPGQAHQQEPEVEGGPKINFDDFAANPQPTMADLQRLEARIDTLTMEHRSGMERLAQEQRSGMQALYRAICASQTGEQLDPTANIFQEHYQWPSPEGHNQ